MKQHNVTIGTDPEFFLKDTITNEYVSAIDYIKGTKYDPEQLPSGGNLQYDNVALEFASPVAVDKMDLLLKIRATFMEIRGKIPTTVNIMAKSSMVFEDKHLQHPDAHAFGCSPDYNAWSLMENNAPVVNSNLRSCGGHLHVGYVDDTCCSFLTSPWGKVNMVRLMDTFHGIVSLLIDNNPESNRRRELYGKAGCYRPTYYGIEYRTLSNFWLKSPELVDLIYSVLQDVISLADSYGKTIMGSEKSVIPVVQEVGADRVINTINTGDVGEAIYIFDNILVNYLSDSTVSKIRHAIETTYSDSVIEAWEELCV